MEYITKDASETKSLGHQIGAYLKGGEILAFSGDLGAGKTTFIQGLAEGLEIQNRIISPTFIIMRKYETSKGLSFYHLDLYRLEKNFKIEIDNLGLSDIWGDKESVVAIEWAEKIVDLLPPETKWITIREEGDKRVIDIK